MVRKTQKIMQKKSSQIQFQYLLESMEKQFTKAKLGIFSSNNQVPYTIYLKIHLSTMFEAFSSLNILHWICQPKFFFSFKLTTLKKKNLLYSG